MKSIIGLTGPSKKAGNALLFPLKSAKRRGLPNSSPRKAT
jgi:hypothetical protein